MCIISLIFQLKMVEPDLLKDQSNNLLLVDDFVIVHFFFLLNIQNLKNTTKFQ